MKLLLTISLLLSLPALAAPARKAAKPVTKEEKTHIRNEQAGKKHEFLDKAEPDCDKKAKEPVKIEPETFTLGGSTGCTLPE
jgi:hypothetical protein